MPNLKYICISDLHAGARTSLLEDLDDERRGAPSQLSKDVALALRAFLAAAGASPQLIMLGDALDLQFSDRSRSFPIALEFLTSLREAGLNSDEVIVTAGNHDHALWTDARLEIEGRSMFSPDAGPSYLEATPAFERLASARSRLTDTLMTQAGFGSVDFRYPNIGFAAADRAVVLHHGHFVESEYRLMSTLKSAMGGRRDGPITVEALSAENAGWIDFFWSTIGDAGFSGDAEMLYQSMLTTPGFRRLSDRWSRKFSKAVLEALPLPKTLEMHDMARRFSRVALDLTVGAFRDESRYAEVDSLTQGAKEGLRWYVGEPVLEQITRELKTVPSDVTFVFGHTHKPFSERVSVPGFERAVKVHNSGGWTLNGPRLDNAEGASMVLIDEDLNVASLRLFSTPRNGHVRPAYLELLSDAPNSEFAASLQAAVEASAPAWEAVARSAQAAYRTRQDYLLRLTGPETSAKRRAMS